MERIRPFASMANMTLLLVAACLAVALASRRPGRAIERIRGCFNRRLIVGLIIAGGCLHALLGLYKGYAVPRDVMQDLLSAREYLSGRSPYPSNMTALFQASVAANPPGFSLLARWPERRAAEDEARREVAGLHWVQAHPPAMTLLAAPLVAALGFSGAYFAIVAASLICLAITFRLIIRGLDFHPTGLEALAIGFAVLGWGSTVTLIRNGQTGFILECLLVIGWYALKRGRSVTAGLAIAAAASIKLYPGLELAYLWHRHRLAYFTTLGTIGLIVVGSASLCGWHSFVEHAQTAREVVVRYADYPTNMSLLGALVRGIRLAGGTDEQSRMAYFAAAAAIVTACVWLTGLGRAKGDEIRRPIPDMRSSSR